MLVSWKQMLWSRLGMCQCIRQVTALRLHKLPLVHHSRTQLGVHVVIDQLAALWMGMQPVAHLSQGHLQQAQVAMRNIIRQVATHWIDMLPLAGLSSSDQLVHPVAAFLRCRGYCLCSQPPAWLLPARLSSDSVTRPVGCSAVRPSVCPPHCPAICPTGYRVICQAGNPVNILPLISL